MVNINGICSFKNFVIPDKSDIISISLFKMKSGYKNFEKYINGLELFNNTIFKKIKNIIVVLFIDGSIVNEPEIYDRIKKLNSEKFIVVEFMCDKFIDEKNPTKGHYDLFGTMVRFLPFFDFEGNNTGTVMSVDADIQNVSDIDIMARDYRIFKKIKPDYHYTTNPFYEVVKKWALEKDYTIVAARHICNKKFPIKLMTDFLNCANTKSCHDIEIMKQQIDYDKYERFPYGIDEYFMNNIMLPYMKQQNMVYSVAVRYSITAPLFFLMWDCNNECQKIVGEFLGKVLNTTDTNARYLFKKFDKMFFQVKNEDIKPYQKEIAKKYYSEIKNLKKNNDHRMFKEFTLDKILKYKKDNVINKTNIMVYKGGKLTKKYVLAVDSWES